MSEVKTKGLLDEVFDSVIEEYRTYTANVKAVRGHDNVWFKECADRLEQVKHQLAEKIKQKRYMDADGKYSIPTEILLGTLQTQNEG